MEKYWNAVVEFMSPPPVWFIVIGSIVVFITLVAQVALFAKCRQPGWAAFVPFYNVIIFLKIIGRPAWQVVYLLIPVFNIYFGFLLLIEICKCLGQRTKADYIYAVLLNFFYVFHMAMTHSIKYRGPIYGPDKVEYVEKELVPISAEALVNKYRSIKTSRRR